MLSSVLFCPGLCTALSFSSQCLACCNVPEWITRLSFFWKTKFLGAGSSLCILLSWVAFSLQGSLKQEGSWTLDAVFHCCGGSECLLDCAAFVLFRFVIPRNKLNLQGVQFQVGILYFCNRKALLTSEWDRDLGNECAERKRVIVSFICAI